MRRLFFGSKASTHRMKETLKDDISSYEHYDVDIRDYGSLEGIFSKYKNDIAVIIHTAAQPSHGWAAKDPILDFSVNANGTLNLLDLTRKYSCDASFIFLSTNKVYGDTPNRLPLIETKMRFEIEKDHKYYKKGIDETMSIDTSLHSLFGVSKASADLLVQEYGRYFGLKTVCFRAGCLTGKEHAGAKLHGFLSYLVKCNLEDMPYSIIGYQGKQLRDNIHSSDVIEAIWLYFENPKPAQVYNIGGGRSNSISVLEVIELTEKITNKKMKISYEKTNRKGDHKWWISDFSKFQEDYPSWSIKYNVRSIIEEMAHLQKAKKLEVKINAIVKGSWD